MLRAGVSNPIARAWAAAASMASSRFGAPIASAMVLLGLLFCFSVAASLRRGLVTGFLPPGGL
jgi:hypothetical protein